MKMKYLKRFLSVLLTGFISLNAVSLAAFAEETNDSSHFTCTVTDGVATLATFDNLITDVTMPEQVVVEGTTYKFEDQTLKIDNLSLDNIESTLNYLTEAVKSRAAILSRQSLALLRQLRQQEAMQMS